MSESSEKQQLEITEQLKKIFGNKVSLKDKQKIEKLIYFYNKNKEKAYFQESHQPKSIMHVIRRSLENIAEVNPDAKIELYMHEKLQQASIPFLFQYTIGPFRVDFLINDNLAFEIDGPMHNKEYDHKRDKYLKNMGYDVLKVPVWLIEANNGLVIDEIKARINHEKRDR